MKTNEFKKDKLCVKIFDTREEMGKTAAMEIATCLKKLLCEKDEVNMIFAAAPSQNEVLYHLCQAEGIDWTRVNAFHMDEYIGLAQDAPQGFGNFLKEKIFKKLPFKSVNTIDSENEAEAECIRYGRLLEEYPTDIVCMGIGENGHIAFNDPWVADFNDEKLIKVVKLDEMCRGQQVHDGCFASLSEVPEYALTLTIPSLVCAPFLFCVVPASTKAEAVKNTVKGDISEECPASILRLQEHAVLYLDQDSSALIV